LVVDCDQLRCTEGYLVPSQSSQPEHQRRVPVQAVTGALSFRTFWTGFVILCGRKSRKAWGQHGQHPDPCHSPRS